MAYATLNRKSLTPIVKAQKNGVKMLTGIFTIGEKATKTRNELEVVADLNAVVDYLVKVRNVITQTGDGVGKRISGATGHDTESQIKAFVARATDTNVPSIE